MQSWKSQDMQLDKVSFIHEDKWGITDDFQFSWATGLTMEKAGGKRNRDGEQEFLFVSWDILQYFIQGILYINRRESIGFIKLPEKYRVSVRFKTWAIELEARGKRRIRIQTKMLQ